MAVALQGRRMRDLDGTDLEIVRLLVADGRRPYSDIADHVGLSPPAVADRVERLREQGLIRGFTAEIDRSAFGGRTPLLLRIEADPASVEKVFADVRSLEGVERAFQLAEGEVVASADAPEDVTGWLEGGIDLSAVRSYDVSLVTESDRSDDLPSGGFVLDCVVCGNEVGPDGITARIDGDLEAFCCPSCESRYRERYERYEDAAD